MEDSLTEIGLGQLYQWPPEWPFPGMLGSLQGSVLTYGSLSHPSKHFMMALS